jgi:hypothetical protein
MIGWASAPTYHFPSTRTCFGTDAATPWPTPATIPERSKPEWGTQHTVRYTELSPTLFKDFWRE